MDVGISAELDYWRLVQRLWMADERSLRDPWAQLGALAGTTCTVQIGICVIGPFMRQPAFTAAAAATPDELSGGRVVLGLGAGGTGFAALWTAAEHPARAVHERVELRWLLWTRRQPFSLEGDLIGFRTDNLHFRPPRTIPVHVAARGTGHGQSCDGAAGPLTPTF